jgi:hypothetical protein
MPFNPVYNLKVANIWLQAESEVSRTQSPDSVSSSSSEARVQNTNNTNLNVLSTYTYNSSSYLCSFTSCLLSHIFCTQYDAVHCKKSRNAQAGFIYVAFWSVFLYVLGSIVYLIDSLLLWPRYNPNFSDDYNNPAIYLNTVGAAIFVLDAIVCFIDWYLQSQQIAYAEKIAKVDLLTSIVGISPSTSWLYFFNNIFFMAAALICMIQAVWYRAIAEDLVRCERTM